MGKRLNWEAIEKALNTGSISMRYLGENYGDRITLWTTTRLYQRGPSLAALVERDGSVVYEKKLFDKRGDARKWAMDYFTATTSYVIQEEPS